MTQIFPKPENLAKLVFLIRGEKVLLDTDLADLYGVETGALNRAVKRNIERFPADFMLQLTPEEWENLKCQIGISSSPVAPAKDKKLGAIRSQVVTASAHLCSCAA
jgi:ORF6N domain